MALTRKMLRAMGIEDEKIDQIIEAHGETVDALKAERDGYKADADKLKDVQTELDGLKAKGDDGYKEKFENIEREFNDFKQAQTAKETKAAKERAFREILKAAGIPEKRFDAIVKISDLSGIELDEKGAAKDAKERTEAAKTEWADFIPTTSLDGADTSTPPENNPSDKDPFEAGFDEG